jgi:hypothetical protein
VPIEAEAGRRQRCRICDLNKRPQTLLVGVGVHDPLARHGGRPGLVGRRRYDMDDVIAAAFQFTQQIGQRLDRLRLDIVEQQDALAIGLDTLQRPRIDLSRADLFPVVGRRVDAPGPQLL